MKQLICENPSCGKSFLRYPKDILVHFYCSKTCAVKINNHKFPKRKAEIRICNFCKRIFKKIGKISKFCSTHCKNSAQTKFSSQQLIADIKTFYKEFNRAPAKRELPRKSDATIRFFGSWNKAVEFAGVKPNRSHDHRMYKRMMTTAKDGHKCDSISEALIDNWLTERHITHERDAKYPNTKHKADWKIAKNTFVEYFGLAHDSPRYDREIKIKRELCKTNKIELIEIYPADLYPELKLAKKFS